MAAIVSYDNIPAVPAHLANRAVTNNNFLSGLPQGGGYPTIGMKGTRFQLRMDGVVELGKSLELKVVFLDAKATLDRALYLTAYDPNSAEVKAPDCYSRDNIKPDPSSEFKQAESCAGCPMNQWKSAKKQDGSPAEGKACSETKIIAVFGKFNDTTGIYGLKVPPASLKNLSHHIKETSRRGIDLSTALTVIEFDENISYPVFKFGFGGFLPAELFAKTEQMKLSSEVADIIGVNAAPAIVAPVMIEQVKIEEKPVEADPFAEMSEPVVEKPKAPAKPNAVKEKPVKVVTQIANGADELADLAASFGACL